MISLAPDPIDRRPEEPNMERLEGEKPFSLPCQAILAKLSDLSFLVECIPDAVRVRDVGERSAAVVIRPGFSFLRGELNLTIELLPDSAADSARYLFQTKGIGSTSAVESGFRAEPIGEGTLLRWSVEVKHLGGLLNHVPRGLIQAGARKVIDDLLARVAAKLTVPSSV
jgi:carbon monoxide dehydrogenase subunit G